MSIISEIEEDMLDRAARELAEDIDSNLAIDMMKDIGYTEVKLDSAQLLRYSRLSTIKPWIAENIRGHYMVYKQRWVFEDAEEATLFVLKWG
jgi:hypothetical protein